MWPYYSLCNPELIRWLNPLIRHMIECDGIITSGPACFEPREGLSALTAWLAETSRSLYAVGPLQPLDNNEHAVAQEKTMSQDSEAIGSFMERTLEENGERSMIFVSLLLISQTHRC